MDGTRALSPTDLFAHHPRRWEHYRYVYPVISRRSGGLSIGINLNPDAACNFHCVYCSVDRTHEPETRAVDLDRVRAELRDLLQLAASGGIYAHEPFDATPPALRRVSDIAFSGDGEPTTYPRFDEVVALAAEARRELAPGAKLVLITNATVLERAVVRRGLGIFDAHGGEVWAKLDAGTEAYYRLVDRSRVPLTKVLGNLLACARARPITIQTMLLTIRGEPMPDGEFDAYLDRLGQLQHAGGRLAGVQLYTVARQTAEPWAAPLERAALERFAARFHERCPALPVAVYAADGA